MISYGNTINIQSILQSNKLNQSDSWFLNCVILYHNMHMEKHTEYKYPYNLVRSFTKIEIHNQEPKKWIKSNYYEMKFILVMFIELDLFPSSCDFENCALLFIPLKTTEYFSHFVIIIIDIWIHYQVRMRFLSFFILIVFIFINSSLYSLVHCHIFDHR